MACHNHRCWLLLPTKLHISSISAASTCRRITSTCGGASVWSNLSLTCLAAGAFFLSTAMTVAELTRKTRTISRTPLPLSVMSTICCLTPDPISAPGAQCGPVWGGSGRRSHPDTGLDAQPANPHLRRLSLRGDGHHHVIRWNLNWTTVDWHFVLK